MKQRAEDAGLDDDANVLALGISSSLEQANASDDDNDDNDNDGDNDNNDGDSFHGRNSSLSPEVGRRDASAYDDIDRADDGRLSDIIFQHGASPVSLDVASSPAEPEDAPREACAGHDQSPIPHSVEEQKRQHGGQQKSPMDRLRQQLASETAMLTDDVMHLLCVSLKTDSTAYRILDPLWLEADNLIPPTPFPVKTGDRFLVPIHHKRACHWTLIQAHVEETCVQAVHYDSLSVGAETRKQKTDLLFGSWLLRLADPKRGLESSLQKVRACVFVLLKNTMPGTDSRFFSRTVPRRLMP